MTLLKLDDVLMEFGGLKAVNQLSFEIQEGQIFGLVGPNGSGKTTTFNMISGYYKPTAGAIYFDGNRIDGLKMHEINKAGIARTFQLISLFKNMTVLDNVIVGRHNHFKTNLLSCFLATRETKREMAENKADAEAHLNTVGLLDKCEEKAKNLPYGEQRMLEIARALASEPKLLILDEPAAGMNPTEKDQLKELILKIRNTGTTILVIEHDMKFIMAVTDNIAVLDHGMKIAEGRPQEIQKNEEVIKAYLGKHYKKSIEQQGGITHEGE